MPEPNFFHFDLAYRRTDGTVGHCLGAGQTAEDRDKKAANSIEAYLSLGWSIVSCDCSISCGSCLGTGRIRKGKVKAHSAFESWKECKACHGVGIFREPTGAEIEAAKA